MWLDLLTRAALQDLSEGTASSTPCMRSSSGWAFEGARAMLRPQATYNIYIYMYINKHVPYPSSTARSRVRESVEHAMYAIFFRLGIRR